MSNVTSQSELTTKEIVEQAISDYHESILPYLNGMVPTIANKFSKSDLLSYDEKIVGCAPDGKPLYQKTIDCGVLPNNTDKTIAHGISNIDIVWSVKGCSTSLSKGFLPIPSIDPASLNWSIGVWGDATAITIRSKADYSTYNMYATIRYTKTTDAAIAIGSDTDYSLEEKIIGTWIDGKPIYMKSVAINQRMNWQTGGIDRADLTIVNPISNMERILDAKAEGILNGNLQFASIDITKSNNNLLLYASDNIYIEYLTLYYTKTTDV